MTASFKFAAIETAWRQVGNVLNRKDLSPTERELVVAAQELMRQAVLEVEEKERNE
jgi:hypothetical protein